MTIPSLRPMRSAPPRAHPCASRLSRAGRRWLLAGLVLLALPGCRDDNEALGIEGFGAGRSLDGPSTGPATAGDHLHTTVHGVQSMDRIAPSQFEERRAAAGNRLLVLDVSVSNRGSEPRVFSEGRLVAVQAGREQAFGRPIDMLSDGFLSLQVLEPEAKVRGKIVYEVPEKLSGRLYWVPGEGGARIALDPVDAPGQPEPPEPPEPAGQQDAAPIAGPVQEAVPARPEPRDDRAGAGDRAVGSVETAPAQASASRVWSGASRWPPRPGPAFNCDKAWTRVEHVVCKDELLSSMDWELNRAFALARRSVDDRQALQREEDAWRFEVRDVCPDKTCIEAAYEKRIGELYAMARD